MSEEFVLGPLFPLSCHLIGLLACEVDERVIKLLGKEMLVEEFPVRVDEWLSLLPEFFDKNHKVIGGSLFRDVGDDYIGLWDFVSLRFDTGRLLALGLSLCFSLGFKFGSPNSVCMLLRNKINYLQSPSNSKKLCN